jgi:hypothetical protein
MHLGCYRIIVSGVGQGLLVDVADADSLAGAIGVLAEPSSTLTSS